MYIIYAVIFSVIISLLCILKRQRVIETFTNGSMPEIIEDHVCEDGTVLTGIGNLYKEQSVVCVRNQCNKVKCWFMKAVVGDEGLYEFNIDFNHMRIIDRDPTTMECLNKDTLGNILKNIPVTIKTIDEVSYDSVTDKLTNKVEEVDIPDALYICFHQHENVTDMELKNIEFSDLNKSSSDMNVIIDVRGVFNFDDEFICKKAIDGVVSGNNIPLTDIKFKRYLKKMPNDDAYEIVYKRIEPKNVTTRESEIFQDTPPYIHTIGKTKLTLKVSLANICDTDCSDTTDKKFYVKGEDNVYNRTNFVDPITKLSAITSEMTACVLENQNAIENKEINTNKYEYVKVNDTYKVAFEFNNPDVWYEDGESTNKKAITNDCKVNLSEPIKKYPLNDAKNWIQITDRTCNPCDETHDYEMKIDVGTLLLNANGTSKEYKHVKNTKINGFMQCKSLSIKYTCSILPEQNETIIKTNPIIIMKKKNKEVVLRHVIKVFNEPIDIVIFNDQEYSTYFEPFEIFNNEYDNIVSFIDSGSYKLQLSNLLITLQCEKIDTIEVNKCNIYNENLPDCNYETQYYDKLDDYNCKDYENITCEAKNLNKKSTAQVVCETNEKYSKTEKSLPLLNDDVGLIKSYNDCATFCDARHGCVGIDFNIQTNKCSFYGYETSKLEVSNTLDNSAYNIKTYDIDSQMKEYVNLKGTFTKVFNPTISFKKIILKTDSEFKGTVKLYDFENNLQKEFSNMIDDKATNETHIARYETSSKTYELEFFYTDASAVSETTDPV